MKSILFGLMTVFFLLPATATYAATTEAITLESGWNIISPSQPIESHSFSAAETVSNFEVFVLDADETSQWNTMAGIGHTEFQTMYGYFINNKTGSNQTLTLAYKDGLTPAERILSRNLTTGWHSIGFITPDAIALQTAKETPFVSLSENAASIFGADITAPSGISKFIDFTTNNTDFSSPYADGTWQILSAIPQVSDNIKIVNSKGYAMYLGTDETASMNGIINGATIGTITTPTPSDPYCTDCTSQSIYTMSVEVTGSPVEINALDFCITPNTYGETGLALENVGVYTNGTLANTTQTIGLTDDTKTCTEMVNNGAITLPVGTNYLVVKADIPANIPGGVFADVSLEGDENASGTTVTGTYTITDGTPVGIVMGTPDPISRGLVARKLVDTFYGANKNDLADAFADPDAPTFTDVSAEHLYFEEIEIIGGLDIMDDFGDGTFRPQNALSRSEAIKTIIDTADIKRFTLPAPPFTDVTDTHWFYDYVTTAHYHEIIEDGTLFNPSDDVSTSDFNTWLNNAKTVLDFDGLKVRVDTAQNPSAQNIPQGANNVEFLAISFHNNTSDDIEITGIDIAHNGTGDISNISEVSAFANYYQKGSDRTFTGGIAPLNLASDSILMNANSSITVQIVADINSSAVLSDEHYFSVDSITAVVSGTSTSVDTQHSGDVAGNTMTIANITTGELGFTFNNPADAPTVSVGEIDKEVAYIALEANATEDILLQTLTLEFDGSTDSTFENIYAEVSGTRVSDIVANGVTAEIATLNFTDNVDNGLIISAGTTKNIHIKADITGNIGGSFVVGIDNIDTDVTTVGATNNFSANICKAQDVGTICSDDTDATIGDRTIAIDGGDITFSMSSAARDVSPGTNNVEFGILTIANFSEDITFTNGFDLQLLKNGVADPNSTIIHDIRLINTENGATVMGPASVGASGVISFTDEPTISSGGTLELSVQASILGTAQENDEYRFVVDMDSVSIQGVSGNTDVGGSANTGLYSILPSSDIESKNYTITTPTVTFTGTTLSSDTFVTDAEDVLIWKGTITTNNLEDITVRSLTFENTGTATNSDIDNYSLYVIDGATTTPKETNTTPNAGGDAVFSSLNEDATTGIVIPMDETVIIEVRANVSSNPTDGNTLALSLDVSEAAAEDEDATTANITNVTDIIGSTYFLADSGSLAIALDANTPDAGIATANTTDLAVAVYEFTASDEDILVEDLLIQINNVDTSSSLGTDVADDYKAIDQLALFYYDDGTAVKQTNGSAADASVNTSGEALFTGLDLVIEEGNDTLVEIRADLNDMDDVDASAIAESGMTFTTTIDAANASSDIKGADSGATITVTNPTAAKEFYVMNNHVTATLAAGQASTLANSSNQQLIKFTLTSAGDNTDAPFLHEVETNITLIDDSGSDLTVGTVTLYNDDNTNVGTCSGSGTCTITLASPDEIGGGSETYRIEAVTSGVSVDDSINTTININTSAPGSDDITWKDGGSDGTNGVNVQWIDLGSSDTSTTRLENVISN